MGQPVWMWVDVGGCGCALVGGWCALVVSVESVPLSPAQLKQTEEAVAKRHPDSMVALIRAAKPSIVRAGLCGE